MWRSTNLRLFLIQSNGATTSDCAGRILTNPSITTAPLSFHARPFSSDSDGKSVEKKTVEDSMPNATVLEKEVIEADLEGKKSLDMDGPFGTKEVPSAIQSFSDKRIAGCPLILFLMAMVPPKEEGSTHLAFGSGFVDPDHKNYKDKNAQKPESR